MSRAYLLPAWAMWAVVQLMAVAGWANAGAAGKAPADQPLQRHEAEQPHMGTQARIVVYARDQAQARQAIQAGFARIAELDGILSDYRPDSELMRLSARSGQGPVAVSPDMFAVLMAAQTLAQQTDGAFDVTRGPVTRVWRSARRLNELPAAERLRAALAAGNWRDMSLDRSAQTVTLKRRGMTLDVGGIGKGHAADAALAAIAAAGVPRALVALGGDLALGDPPPDAPGWNVDVVRLDVPDAPPTQTLRLHNVAISTAGDAEQWMEVGGRRYSHILDARSGTPMTIRTTTTVIAPRGLDADGLDDAVALLGPQRGKALVERVPGAAVWTVRQVPGADGQTVQVHHSSRWPGGAVPAPQPVRAARARPVTIRGPLVHPTNR